MIVFSAKRCVLANLHLLQLWAEYHIISCNKQCTGYVFHRTLVVFVMLHLFSTKHVNTQIYFCDQTKAIATCSARLAAEKLRWRCKNELVFWSQILWFVAVFSSLVCLLWERPLDTACKYQRAGSFRAIFRYYLAKLVKLWSSYAHAPQKRCFKSLQTENQKIALNDLREATAAHLSEDCVSLRGSVVEKTATNHFVYYFCHTVMAKFINNYLTIKDSRSNTPMNVRLP